MLPLTIWLRKISLLNTVTLKVYSDNFINLVAHMRSWTYVAIMTGMDFPEHRNLSPQFHEPHNRFLPAPSHLHCHSWSSGIFHTFLEEYVFCLCRYLLLSPPPPPANWKYVFCSLESGNGIFFWGRVLIWEWESCSNEAKAEEHQVSSTPVTSGGLLLRVPLYVTWQNNKMSKHMREFWK